MRIGGIDVARGLALIGMLLVNYTIILDAAYNGPEWLVFAVGLFSGKAAALFVILAGVGLSLIAIKTEYRQKMKMKTTKTRKEHFESLC